MYYKYLQFIRVIIAGYRIFILIFASSFHCTARVVYKNLNNISSLFCVAIETIERTIGHQLITGDIIASSTFIIIIYFAVQTLRVSPIYGHREESSESQIRPEQASQTQSAGEAKPRSIDLLRDYVFIASETCIRCHNIPLNRNKRTWALQS